jgi:hypothetical protein
MRCSKIRMRAWTKFYRCNPLHSYIAKQRSEKCIRRCQRSGQRRSGAPFLVSKDVAANLFLFALDCLHVSKHAVRLETLGKLGCMTRPSVRISEWNARNRGMGAPKPTASLCRPASETSCRTNPSFARSQMKRFKSASVFELKVSYVVQIQFENDTCPSIHEHSS